MATGTATRKKPRGWIEAPRSVGSRIEWTRKVGNYLLTYYPVAGEGLVVALPGASLSGFEFRWNGDALRTVQNNPVGTDAVLDVLDRLEVHLSS